MVEKTSSQRKNKIDIAMCKNKKIGCTNVTTEDEIAKDKYEENVSGSVYANVNKEKNMDN